MARALRWLGHECAGGCSTSIDSLAASIWFTRHGGSAWQAPHGTLVVLDLAERGGAALANVREMIDEINRCVRSDGIRVCESAVADAASRLTGGEGSRQDKKVSFDPCAAT